MARRKSDLSGDPLHDGPCLSFDQVRRAWFVLNRRAFSVTECTEKEFKQFVAEQRRMIGAILTQSVFWHYTR